MSIKKNIFLTGERRVGKSTLLNKLLDGSSFSVAGFKTLPHFSGDERDGFYFQSMLNGEADLNCHFISRKTSQNAWLSVTETFENQGVENLKKSLKAKPDIILMDELGFLESQALNFQKHVKQCLDSTIPVLGVIKLFRTPFLDSIRERKDVNIIEVTPLNREKIYDFLVGYLQIKKG